MESNPAKPKANTCKEIPGESTQGAKGIDGFLINLILPLLKP
jgi:hypothetical protein